MRLIKKYSKGSETGERVRVDFQKVIVCGVSRSRLEKILGLSSGTVSKILKGQIAVSLGVLEKWRSGKWLVMREIKRNEAKRRLGIRGDSFSLRKLSKLLGFGIGKVENFLKLFGWRSKRKLSEVDIEKVKKQLRVWLVKLETLNLFERVEKEKKSGEDKDRGFSEDMWSGEFSDDEEFGEVGDSDKED